VFNVEYIQLPGIQPTDSERPWIAGFADNMKEIGIACPAGLMVVIFFFMDQNISSAVCQEKGLNLQKGCYYHSTIFLVGLFNVLGGLFGLPFRSGSLPHSALIVIASTSSPNPSDHSDKTEELRRKRPVVETRVSPLICYGFIGLALFVPDWVQSVPTSVVDGTLIFFGVKGFMSLQIFERFLLFFSEPRLYPPHRFDDGLHHSKMHLYTFIQLLLLAGCWIVDRILGIIFPLWIGLLVPIRCLLIPKIFTREELALLDAHE